MRTFAELPLADALRVKGPGQCRNCGYAATLEQYLRDYAPDFKAIRERREHAAGNDSRRPGQIQEGD